MLYLLHNSLVVKDSIICGVKILAATILVYSLITILSYEAFRKTVVGIEVRDATVTYDHRHWSLRFSPVSPVSTGHRHYQRFHQCLILVNRSHL